MRIKGTVSGGINGGTPGLMHQARFVRALPSGGEPTFPGATPYKQSGKDFKSKCRPAPMALEYRGTARNTSEGVEQ